MRRETFAGAGGLFESWAGVGKRWISCLDIRQHGRVATRPDLILCLHTKACSQIFFEIEEKLTMINRETILSSCRTYRYTLWREFGGLVGDRYAMFIGLNPSTADEINDDPTIRRCIAFAKSWGYGALCMTNLFAFRATEPADMLAAVDPVGPDNNSYLTEMSRGAGVVVAAWGINGTHMERDKAVRDLVPNLHCLRTTQAGHPGHPLYLPGNLIPVQF